MQFVRCRCTKDKNGIIFITIKKEDLLKLKFNLKGETCLHINGRLSVRSFEPKMYDELDVIDKQYKRDS